MRLSHARKAIGVLLAALALQATTSVAAEAAPAPANPEEWPSLAGRLTPIIDDAQADGVALGLFVSDLSGGTFGGKTLYLGKQDSFTTASTIKLSLAATVMHQVEDGTLALSDEVTITADEVVGGSGVLKDRPAPIATTVDEMLDLMITVSDNTATNKLVDVVGGFDEINGLTESAGIATEDLHFGRKMFGAVVPPDGDLWATPYGYKQLLDLYWDAYSGSPLPGFIDESSARHLIRLMRHQQVKTKLGAVIPGQLLAHKTGENGTVSHDLGLLLLAGREVSIGVFTQNDAGRAGDAWYDAVDPYVQQVAALVYDHVLSATGDDGEPVATRTRLSLSSSVLPPGKRARATIRVRGEGGPQGDAVVKVNGRKRATVSLDNGAATYLLPRLKPGKHRITVRFVPDDATVFAPSTSAARVLTVKRRR